jgi:serine/threonine-protein kinase HipA
MMAETLQVFLNRKHLGEISLEGADDRYGLAYSPSWLAEGGFPVSPHLKPDECRPEAVRRFLANLLPEGRWLEELSISTHISKSNTFGLIAAIGSETTGALTFRLGESSLETPPTSFRPVTVEELTERIETRQEHSMALWDGKPRLSVAGVQEKLPILIL